MYILFRDSVPKRIGTIIITDFQISPEFELVVDEAELITTITNRNILHKDIRKGELSIN